MLKYLIATDLLTYFLKISVKKGVDIPSVGELVLDIATWGSSCIIDIVCFAVVVCVWSFLLDNLRLLWI